MGIWLFIQTIVAGVFAGGMVAWLFASPERREDAIDQIRKLRSFSFKVLVLAMAGLVMVRCAYAFVEFAKSTGPISRIEVISLFVYFMNFFAFLTAAILFATIWRMSVLKEKADEAKAG